MIQSAILNHFTGTSVAEFDLFCKNIGWDLELNIGVASKGLRAFTLCVYRTHDHPFSEQEVILGEALAKQLGLAIETCRLIEEARQSVVAREGEATSQQREIQLTKTNDALKQSLDIMASETDLEKALCHILTAIAVQLKAKTSALWLFDKEADKFDLHLVHIEGDIVEAKPENDALLNGLWTRGRDLRLKDHINLRKPVVYQVKDLKKTDRLDPAFFTRQGIHSLLGIRATAAASTFNKQLNPVLQGFLAYSFKNS